jgi:hypothetical protein
MSSSSLNSLLLQNYPEIRQLARTILSLVAEEGHDKADRQSIARKANTRSRDATRALLLRCVQLECAEPRSLKEQTVLRRDNLAIALLIEWIEQQWSEGIHACLEQVALKLSRVARSQLTPRRQSKLVGQLLEGFQCALTSAPHSVLRLLASMSTGSDAGLADTTAENMKYCVMVFVIFRILGPYVLAQSTRQLSSQESATARILTRTLRLCERCSKLPRVAKPKLRRWHLQRKHRHRSPAITDSPLRPDPSVGMQRLIGKHKDQARALMCDSLQGARPLDLEAVRPLGRRLKRQIIQLLQSRQVEIEAQVEAAEAVEIS